VRGGALAASLAVLLSGCGAANPAPSDEPSGTASVRLTSPAFGDGARIPARFTCVGAGQSPPLAWSGVPRGARSLVLVVDDPDAPGGDFVHWLVVDLRPGSSGIPAGGAGPGQVLDNSAGHRAWTPPCPPDGTHHYRFTLYALDGVATTTDRDDLLAGIDRHTVAWGRLTGTVTAH
jgi:Raf kinase inhibitor-like YbhB/YbcL family protein